MAWTELNFGKHAGKSLPQILFADPDWFFWAVDNNVFANRPALSQEASTRETANAVGKNRVDVEVGEVLMESCEHISLLRTVCAVSGVRIKIQNGERLHSALCGFLFEEEIILHLKQRIIFLQSDHLGIGGAALIFHVRQAIRKAA